MASSFETSPPTPPSMGGADPTTPARTERGSTTIVRRSSALSSASVGSPLLVHPESGTKPVIALEDEAKPRASSSAFKLPRTPALVLLALLFIAAYFLPSRNQQPQRARVDDAVRLVNFQHDATKEELLIKFENMRTLAMHEFALHRDTGMFSKPPQASQTGSKKTYMTRRTTSSRAWATAQFSATTNTLVGGHFFAPELGGHFQLEADAHTHRRALEEHTEQGEHVEGFADQVLQAEGRPPPLSPEDTLKTMLRTTSNQNDGPSDFTPDCFPDDAFAHTIKIGFAVDQGFLQRIGATTMEEVQDYIEGLFGVVRVIYLAQLNVYLQVDRILLPSTAERNVLSATPSNGLCSTGGPLVALSQFNAFLTTNGLGKQTAHWHLLTDCFPSPGTVGAAYIGGLCLERQNCAVSSWSRTSHWLTVAHEMGHTFGAEHKFDFGRGGIMDYGNGRYENGHVEFAPENRPELCNVLTKVQRSCRNELFFLAPKEASCGNSLLDLDEECECLDPSKRECGPCKQCRLTSPAQCSTKDFVVRTKKAGGVVEVASAALLAHPDCCDARNMLPTTSARACSSPTAGRVCGATGQCEKTCATYLLKSCAKDSSGDTFEGGDGCVQNCFYEDACWGRELYAVDVSPIPVGAVPDGVPCNGGKGACKRGTCEQKRTEEDEANIPPTTVAPTNASNSSSSSRPTTMAPSAQPSAQPTSSEPTTSPTASPTASPSAMDFSKLMCPNAKKFSTCPKLGNSRQCTAHGLGCIWCQGSCRVAKVACTFPDKPVGEIFAHCPKQ